MTDDLMINFAPTATLIDLDTPFDRKVPDEWFNIDTQADLKHARRLYSAWRQCK